MSVYSISLFLHILGALGLSAALAVEWAGHDHPRRVSGLSSLVILATGIYIAATRWGPQSWIAVGLGGMVIIAALGAALSRRVGAAALCLRLRTALFLGIIFLMSTQPGWAGSFMTLAVATVAGVTAALPARSANRRHVRMAGSDR